MRYLNISEAIADVIGQYGPTEDPLVIAERVSLVQGDPIDVVLKWRHLGVIGAALDFHNKHLKD